MEGKVKFFNESKGFGFISGDDGKEYFVHQSGINEGNILKENDSVTFEGAQGDRGLKAENVSLASSEPAADSADESQDEGDLEGGESKDGEVTEDTDDSQDKLDGESSEESAEEEKKE